MRKNFILAGLVLFVYAVVPAGADNLATGYSSNDTWLDQDNPTTNYGSDYYLHIYGRTSGGDNVPEENFLSKFDLPSLGSGYHVQSATVRMNYMGYERMDSGDRVDVGLYAVRSTRVWTETGANWNTMNGSSYWATAGCESTSIDRYDTLLGSQSFYRSTAFGDKDFSNSSLTQTVRDWYSGSLTNNGLVGRTYAHITGSEGVTFYSNDYGNGWGPRLLISYTLDPFADADGSYLVGQGGSVNFNGTGSYERDNDGSITSWLWDLNNDGLYNEGSGSIVNKNYDYLVNTLHLRLGDNTIGIKVLDDEGEWATDTSILTIVPEPATMMLIGLGGMILRRFKGKNSKPM
jgi:hypothetical protein